MKRETANLKTLGTLETKARDETLWLPTDPPFEVMIREAEIREGPETA